MSNYIPSIADRNYESLSNDVTIFDPPGGTPLILYLGKNGDPDASEDDLNWIIQKFIYVGSDLQKIIKRKGSWTGRVALFP